MAFTIFPKAKTIFKIPPLTFLCQGKMFHHHDGELIYTLREDHHRTSVECHFHGECPKKRSTFLITCTRQL